MRRLQDLVPGEAAGREQARDAARDELSRREYADAQPNPVLRLIGRGLRELGDLFARATGSVGDGGLATVLLVLLLLGVVLLLVVRLGPGSRRQATGAVFDGSRELSADEHRAAAEGAAARGAWAEAVRERLRAAVRELEARGVLDPRPGRTAGEVARDAGTVVPELGPPLRRAAVVFDEVWYGGREADASSYEALVAVDDEVRRARVVTA